jgi:hypothetical protein
MSIGQSSASLNPLPRAILVGLAVWYGAQMLAGPLIMWAWVALELDCNYGCLFLTFGLPIIAAVAAAAASYRRSAARPANPPPSSPA